MVGYIIISGGSILTVLILSIPCYFYLWGFGVGGYGEGSRDYLLVFGVLRLGIRTYLQNEGIHYFPNYVILYFK